MRTLIAVVLTGFLITPAVAIEPPKADKQLIECGPIKGAVVELENGELTIATDGFGGQVLRVEYDVRSMVVSRHGGLPGPLDRAVIVNSSPREHWYSYVSIALGVTRLFTLFPDAEPPVLVFSEHQTRLGPLFGLTKIAQARTFVVPCR